jgi:endogenous inhibitor of DNA gyrase (YacG/DUF329 family)
MDDAPLAKPARPCPICGKPAAAKSRPFCSERCRMVDLGRWFAGIASARIGCSVFCFLVRRDAITAGDGDDDR